MVTWKGDTRGEAEGRYERGRALNQMNSHGQERQRPVVDQLYAFLENRALIASVIRDAAYRVLWSCRRRSPCRVPCPGARVACLSVPALHFFFFFFFLFSYSSQGRRGRSAFLRLGSSQALRPRGRWFLVTRKRPGHKPDGMRQYDVMRIHRADAWVGGAGEWKVGATREGEARLGDRPSVQL
jgi:hypothetical protein